MGEPRHACYKCGDELIFEVKIGRRDMCPTCGAYLHSCLNCKHHDPYAHNECREGITDHISDRTEGNFCLYFAFREVEEDLSSEANSAKTKLNAMFGGKKDSTPTLNPNDPRARLDSLFKKK